MDWINFPSNVQYFSSFQNKKRDWNWNFLIPNYKLYFTIFTRNSLETRAELAVLRIYVENQAILEPILFYRAPILSLPFDKIIVSFFPFFCQDEYKTRSNCAIIGCNLSKKRKLTLYKTQNGESNYVDHSFSLIFTRSYLPVKTLGEEHRNTIELAVVWSLYCVTSRLNDIKNLTSVSVEYTMEIHLADASFTFLVKVLPPPFHYSLGSYLYSFLLYILLSQNW